MKSLSKTRSSTLFFAICELALASHPAKLLHDLQSHYSYTGRYTGIQLLYW